MVIDMFRYLSVDFDGVLHARGPWKGPAVVNGQLVPGALKFLAECSEKMRVGIFSGRSAHPGAIEAMRAWLVEQAHADPNADMWLPLLEWWLVKPPAQVFLDDRAITFRGEFPSVNDVLAFRPWTHEH